MEGKILDLLIEGHSLSAIAKTTNKSPAAILKRARKYVLKGVIERITRGRYRAVQKMSILPPLKPVGDFTTPSSKLPVMLPHKFGASFALTPSGRMPGLLYDNWGKAEIKTQLFYAQVGRYKVQIWLYNGFEGSHPDELINSGKNKIIAIARSISNQYKRDLTLLRFYSDIEWVDISKERSKGTAKEAGFRKRQRVEVADAIHVLDGSSHNDLLEIDKAPGKPDGTPTDHARIRHALYSGEYERRFDMVMTALERMTEVFEEMKIRMDIKKVKP